MAQQTLTNIDSLDAFYDHVREAGKLRQRKHAQRYTNAVLRTLGLYLKGSSKKALANALPDELSEQFKRAFFLAHFPDKTLPWTDFCKMVARRSGNSDGNFARIPTRAVFQGLQALIDSDTSRKVAEALSPEVQAEWEQARG